VFLFASLTLIFHRPPPNLRTLPSFFYLFSSSRGSISCLQRRVSYPLQFRPLASVLPVASSILLFPEGQFFLPGLREAIPFPPWRKATPASRQAPPADFSMKFFFTDHRSGLSSPHSFQFLRTASGIFFFPRPPLGPFLRFFFLLRQLFREGFCMAHIFIFFFLSEPPPLKFPIAQSPLVVGIITWLFSRHASSPVFVCFLARLPALNFFLFHLTSSIPPIASMLYSLWLHGIQASFPFFYFFPIQEDLHRKRIVVRCSPGAEPGEGADSFGR